MQIVVLAGGHATRFSFLHQCLQLNLKDFQDNGVAVTEHKQYQQKLDEFLSQSLVGCVVPELMSAHFFETNEISFRELRTVISSESLLGVPRLAARGGRLYPRAAERVRALTYLLPEAEIELITVIRNPATFLPALFEMTSSKSFEKFTDGYAPITFSWLEVFSELSQSFPYISFSVYCYEDLPFVWGDLMREVGGLCPTSKILGEYAFAEELMTDDGQQRMKEYLRSKTGFTQLQKRRVIAAFLEKYIRKEELEQVIDVPGWDADLVDELTEKYEDDLQEIAKIPNVFLAEV